MIMTYYPDAVWTKSELTDQLVQLAHLFKSKVFNPARPFTRQSQFGWIKLIGAVSDLVRQASLAGRRISFTDEVSTQQDTQDITTLLDIMRQSAHVVGAITPAQRSQLFVTPTLNYFSGVGSGHFANGLFFICPHKNEQAFFIGRNRVYLYRHLMRAYVEAGRYLTSLPASK
ncbi:hypothetical protein DYU11_25725 [Fibrisoma montanum]|uniref:Uncharacterized protein n=1 Tax=Fibrisoma montanum TaxID=2305895 RepID=A0A418M1X1_9BACT|nr:hypothetical protein [Fibrisoma montanum]RIV19495.1 hypothetical protein DYU11_25725 [Fibrisoma montanum]